MNLTFNEEERMYQQTFREFMDNECSQEVVEEIDKGEKGYSPVIWEKMAGLGWLGLGLADEQDHDMVVICILCEEMGKVLLPVPYIPTVVLGGGSVLAGAKEILRTQVLESIENGSCVISSALMERDRYEGFDTGECEAAIDNGGYLLNGRKTYVKGAHVADYVLLTAGTGGGVTAFLVDPHTSGITLEPLRAMGGERFFNLSLRDVQIAPEFMLGEAGEGPTLLQPVIHRARAALAARMVGGASAVLDKSVEYARERVQFGKPIGSFQAIAFKLADMATEVSGARLLVYKAAWLIDEGEAGTAKEAAMAKAFASELYQTVADVGVHIHGGYGFMMEHDLQLYYRKAKADELSFGDADYNRALVYGAG